MTPKRCVLASLLTLATITTTPGCAYLAIAPATGAALGAVAEPLTHATGSTWKTALAGAVIGVAIDVVAISLVAASFKDSGPWYGCPNNNCD